MNMPLVGVWRGGFEPRDGASEKALDFTQRGVMLAVAIVFQQDRGAAKEGDEGLGRFVAQHRWPQLQLGY
jgi:hypothetical protein